MKYVDMHCDTLTACFDKKYGLADCPLHTNYEKLNNSECAAQCFAVFTQGDFAARDFERYFAFYSESIKKHGIPRVLNSGDLKRCMEQGVTGAVLTVENLGFLDDLSKIRTLAERGVRMASLVWNFENDYAFPNLLFENGLPLFDKREQRGLKDKGREAVELLDENKIIIDISHLSDGGAEDILNGRKIPVVASHSNAAAAYNLSRNLTDGLIKKIAGCGGAIGVNFCKDFLGEGEAFECVLRHVKHIVKTGGEDVIALGSDFDGIPTVQGLEDCTKMQALLRYLESNGIKDGLLEKLCYKNFARVFADVCG